jgi:phage tail-like protein
LPNRLYNYFLQLIKKKLWRTKLCLLIIFIVDWGGSRVSFAEVSGLDMYVDVTEYREGGDVDKQTHKIPGLTHYSKVVLKRGIMKGDNDFLDWFHTNNGSQVEKRNILITLLNQNHEPILNWKLVNAFPVKLSGPVLIARSSEVAMEELELAHEQLNIETV